MKFVTCPSCGLRRGKCFSGLSSVSAGVWIQQRGGAMRNGNCNKALASVPQEERRERSRVLGVGGGVHVNGGGAIRVMQWWLKLKVKGQL